MSIADGLNLARLHPELHQISDPIWSKTCDNKVNIEANVAYCNMFEEAMAEIVEADIQHNDKMRH